MAALYLSKILSEPWALQELVNQRFTAAVVTKMR